MADLEVDSEDGLSLLVHLRLRVVRHGRGVEKVEEAVRFDLRQDHKTLIRPIGRSGKNFIISFPS